MCFTSRISSTVFFLILCPSVAYAENVILINGDVLSGKIVSESEESLTLEHDILGTLTLPRAQIKTENRDGIAKETEAKKEAMGILGTTFLKNWKKRVALGVKGEDGNDISLNLNGAVNASYEDSNKRLAFNAAYFYESQDNEKNTSKGNAGLIRDWLILENPLFYYTYGRYDYDEFKYWEHRVSAIGGLGYGFFDEKNFKLHCRTGLGANQTWGTENALTPEAQFGVELVWLPNDMNTFSSKFFIFPNFDDFGEYRTQYEAKWEINLSIARGLGFELGIEHEYESKIYETDNKEKHYDLIYFGRIGMDL